MTSLLQLKPVKQVEIRLYRDRPVQLRRVSYEVEIRIHGQASYLRLFMIEREKHKHIFISTLRSSNRSG